jgi:effector-binding domain-containing protein
MALRSMLGLTEPHTFELMDQRMATVMTEDRDRRGAEDVVKALYASVRELQKKHDFEIEPLRARWPADGRGHRPKGVAMWGLPIPVEVDDMPQVSEDYRVRLETWEYGTVAEVLHEGSHAEENRTVDKLRRYIDDQNLEIIGPHEEEYLTPPGAAVPKILIRYRVRVR